MTVSEKPAIMHRSPEKVRPTAAKRITKKKSRGKPKRPLSAYNFFFREEREKIMQAIRSEDTEAVKPDPDDDDDYLTDEQICRLKKNGDKISFEEMGKLIGIRWKNIDPERLNHFSELASKDTDRYKKEMFEFNSRQEEKLRDEALKSPLESSSPHPYALNHGERQMVGAPSSYPTGQQAYAAQMASMGYSAYYNGYSMPMYSYGSYMGPAAHHEARLRAAFDDYASAQQQHYSGAYSAGSTAQQQHYSGVYSAGNSLMGYSQTDQQGNIGSEHDHTGETHSAGARDPRSLGSYQYYSQSNTWGHH